METEGIYYKYFKLELEQSTYKIGSDITITAAPVITEDTGFDDNDSDITLIIKGDSDVYINCDEFG